MHKRKSIVNENEYYINALKAEKVIFVNGQ